MINNKTYIYYDFETGGTDPETSQILSLSAVAIEPRKLVVLYDSIFDSFIKPLDDKEAIKKGLQPIQKSALAVNKIVLADLQDCPDEKTVFENFVNWTYNWNVKKDSWNAPIACGFNINNFDSKIINRLCKKYGYWDEKKNQQKIFNPIQSIDLKDITWLFNESNVETTGNSFDQVRTWLGLSDEFAHQSKTDVIQGAEVLCRFMKLIRYWSSKTKFK